MSKIIITEPFNIDLDSKKKLRTSGYILIEAKDTSKVKIIGDADFAAGNDLFMAALKGANHDQFSRWDFVTELYKRLLESEKLLSETDSATPKDS